MSAVIPAEWTAAIGVEGSLLSHEELSYLGRLAVGVTAPAVPAGETGGLGGHRQV